MRNNRIGRHLAATLSCALGVGMTTQAVCAATISVGSANVPQGTPFVIIPVTIADGESISSISLGFAVGDGGPAVGGATVVPITEVTVPANSIFTSPNFSYSFNTGALPASSATIINIGITDPGESTTANGPVVNVKLDTSNVVGIFTLTADFGGSASVSNLGDPVTFTAVPGTLTVVPEPTFIGLSAASMALLMASRRRTHARSAERA